MTKLIDRTTAATTGDDIRRDLVRQLMDALDADAGVCCKLVCPDGGRGITTAGTIAEGPPEVVEGLLASEGSKLLDTDLDVSDMAAVDAFVLQRTDEMAPTIRDHFWGPLGIGSAICMNVSIGGVLLGYVGLFRIDGSPPFDASTLGRAAHLARDARALMEAAETLEPDDVLPNSACVLGLDGNTLFRTPEPWEGHDELIEQLRHEARQFAEGEGPGERLLGRVYVTMERLHGPAGSAVLVRTTAVHPAALSDTLRLSPLKRRIAAFAIRGATVVEIARTIDRSPETVRAHIKQIYSRLGIGSRVELAEACRTAFE